MKRLGFTRSSVSCLLRLKISYQRIFVVNRSLLDFFLPVLKIHRENFLLLAIKQLSWIGQTL